MGDVLLILRALALVAAAGIALAVGQPAADATPASSAVPATDGMAYVALGDSYAAGYGLTDLTGEPVAACAQSAHDYPHRVAKSLGLDLTDVTCAGATTSNLTDTDQFGAAPQTQALGKGTRVVTISIGGNDADLFGTASSCIALGEDGPIFGESSTTTSCKQTLDADGDDTLATALDTTVATGLRSAFSDVAAKAPNARVFVVGYPSIFPDTAHTPSGGCFRAVVDGKSITDGFPQDAFPFTDTDVAYLHGVQRHLDRVGKAEAARAGFTFVSTLADSEGHSACATSGSYIEGIALQASSGFSKITLQEGALHPNESGAAYLADQTTTAIRASFAKTPTAEAPASANGAAVELVWPVLAAVFVAAVVLVLVARRRRRQRRGVRDDG